MGNIKVKNIGNSYSMLKELWENIYPFSCTNFVAKNLRCPFGRSGMHDKIPKLSLDHCLLDANGIMQKNQPFNVIIF